jgi:hypothetical protein
MAGEVRRTIDHEVRAWILDLTAEDAEGTCTIHLMQLVADMVFYEILCKGLILTACMRYICV